MLDDYNLCWWNNACIDFIFLCAQQNAEVAEDESIPLVPLIPLMPSHPREVSIKMEAFGSFFLSLCLFCHSRILVN